MHSVRRSSVAQAAVRVAVSWRSVESAPLLCEVLRQASGNAWFGSCVYHPLKRAEVGSETAVKPPDHKQCTCV